MPVKLSTFFDVATDGPWCGTRPFHWPHVNGGGGGPPTEFFRLAGGIPTVSDGTQHLPPRWWQVGSGSHPHFDEVATRAAGPQPQPWVVAGLASAAFASVDLFGIGQRLGGAEGEAIGRAASDYFDGVCGSVPISVLIWILEHVPHPPTPWVERIGSAAVLVEFAAAASAGEASSPMVGAARQVLRDALSVLDGGHAGEAERGGPVGAASAARR